MLVLLERAIAMLANIAGILGTVLGLTQESAKEHAAYNIETVVTNAQLAIQNPTYGLSALHADLAAAVTAINAHTDAALDGLQVTATVPDEPTWYTAPTTPPDTDSIAYAVWGHQGSMQTIDGWSSGLGMGTIVEGAWAVLDYLQGWYGVPLAENPYVGICAWEPTILADGGMQWYNVSTSGHPPIPDWSQWQSDDTVYSFLSRTQPSVGWTNTGPNGITTTSRAWVMGTYHGISRPYYVSRFTELEALALAALAPTPTIEFPPSPPVWPGASKATIGTPVALTSSLVVDGPLDGIIVHVTNSPAGLGRFAIGGYTYFYKLGEVSFVTDGGYVEPWQYIGWDHGLYTPRSQSRATTALLRGLAGVTGTATPWTIT